MVVIAISGLPGSGSTSVSKLVASKLGLNHFSPGRVFKDVGRGIIKEQYYFPLFEEICSKEGLELQFLKTSNDSEAVVSLWGTELGSSRAFHEAIDKLQKSLAEKGDIVIDGKLSLHMLPNAHLKVWLTADSRARIRRSAQRDNISLDQAALLLPYRESQEAQEWERIYGVDYRNQKSTAHLVIDTTSAPIEETANRIIVALKDKF